MNKPNLKPANPNFSSGPTSKRPGWEITALSNALTGRSHRSVECKARLKEAIDKSKNILGLPEDYLLGIMPGSNTGALEAAMWCLLGKTGVDILAWENFGKDWVIDAISQLKLKNLNIHEEDYGKLPDLSKVNFDKKSKEVGMVFSEAMEKAESISKNENNHAALDRVADISCTSSNVSKVKKCLNDIMGNSTRKHFDKILDNYKILLDIVFNGTEEMFYYAGLTVVEAANVRDPRDGRGERDHFYRRFAMIYEKDKHVAAVLLNHMIKTHGSFLDLKKMWNVNSWYVDLTLAEDFQSLIAVCVANSIHKDIIAFREWEKLKSSMDPSEEGISNEEKDKRNVLHNCPPECSLATKWIPKIHGTCRNDEQARYSKIKNKLE